LCSYVSEGVSEWVSKALLSEPITTKYNRCQMRIIYYYWLPEIPYKDAMFVSSKQSGRRPVTLSFGPLPIYIGPYKCVFHSFKSVRIHSWSIKEILMGTAKRIIVKDIKIQYCQLISEYKQGLDWWIDLLTTYRS
jgi:hypothetical protein